MTKRDDIMAIANAATNSVEAKLAKKRNIKRGGKLLKIFKEEYQKKTGVVYIPFKELADKACMGTIEAAIGEELAEEALRYYFTNIDEYVTQKKPLNTVSVFKFHINTVLANLHKQEAAPALQEETRNEWEELFY